MPKRALKRTLIDVVYTEDKPERKLVFIIMVMMNMRKKAIKSSKFLQILYSHAATFTLGCQHAQQVYIAFSHVSWEHLTILVSGCLF